MNIQWVRHIDGPNVYLYKPILVVKIDLGDYTERESTDFAGFSERLLRLLPGLRDHHCAKGRPGGFVERLYNGTYFGHIAEHVAIEFATCIGLDVHYGKTVLAEAKGQYEVIMECKAFECQKFLFGCAVNTVESIVASRPISLETIFEQARYILAKTELGPSTQAIYDACLRRNIPVRRIGTNSLLELGYGIYRKRIEATITESTSAVAVDIACDKDLTKSILEMAGIPVPRGGIATSQEEAVRVFETLNVPVVVKPHNGNQGRGVSLNLYTIDSVLEAYAIAKEFSSTVIVEPYVAGTNVRILVVNGKCVAASERQPAHVVGDGQHSIADLIERVNRDKRRGMGHEKPLTRIRVDAVVEATLRQKGFVLSYVPRNGETVFLRGSANLSTGGEARDVTNTIHVSYRLMAERAARLIGLDICGIDMVIQDLLCPAKRHNCAIIEVNAAPGIRMHQHPSYGASRNVADFIVEGLYPAGRNGQIPIVSVTGTNGKTTTTRLIGHGIAANGKCVGMTTTGGVYIGGKLVLEGDTTGPSSARMVLSDPVVEVAVLETARGGIIREGLAYEKANIAVVTNITLDHIGQDGIDTVDDLIRVKSLVAECVHDDGIVVLNADNHYTLIMASRLGTRVVLFSTKSNHEAIAQHLKRGGTAYYVKNGWITEARGNLTWDIVQVDAIPLTMRGRARFHVENCLAAAASLRGLGLSRQQVSESLLSFQPELHNHGRCMMYQMPNGSHVVLDYGHNPAGFESMGEWLLTIPRRSLIGVVGVPGDRANNVVEQAGASLAGIFDCFIVKEDEDKRGRLDGEVAMILAHQIRQKYPYKRCEVVLREQEALSRAISASEPGDIIVMFYERFGPLEELIECLGGRSTSVIEPKSLIAGHVAGHVMV